MRRDTPLARAAATIVGLLIFAFSVFIGAFAVAVIAGLALLTWLVLAVRWRWMRHRTPASGGKGGGGQVIEGEYRVERDRSRDG